MRGWILALEPGDARRLGRTKRAFAQAGIAPEIVESRDDVISRLASVNEPVLLLVAGAWFVEKGALPPIPTSATGRPLIALGAGRDSPDELHPRWREAVRKHGGDFDHACELPPVASVYLEPSAACAFATSLKNENDVSRAWTHLLAAREFRKVHFPALDVHEFAGMRVLQVITSIQLGGAERVTLDLAHELSRQGLAVAVAALGRPTREAFPEPPDFYDLSRTPCEASARGAAIAEAAREFGADLVHAHLITADEAREVRARGLPLVMSLHNTPEGWPVGIGRETPCADLTIACSCAVEDYALAAQLATPIRTVWNGIDPTIESSAGMRAEFGWNTDDFVVLAIANPRRQKRLDRLPAILAALQPRLAPRHARLLIAGAPARGSADAEAAAASLRAAIAASPARADIAWPGALDATGDMLATGDVLISVSAHEGLSLAHLEALAAGVPVLATEVGGTGEIAAQTPAMTLLPPDAEDAAFVDALEKIASGKSPRTPSLPASFTRQTMAARTRWLYPRILSRKASAGDGVWLITNNFSTGGAQSSARRLLAGLALRGVKVRATVVEEHPSHPTAGRAALIEAGIPVLAIPPPDLLDAPDAVARILAAIDADPPRAVLFWNLIPVFKILLADALLHTPVFDVSPGEMFFTSLTRYFANPRTGLPYRSPREYGARLAGVIVKYAAESGRASQTLGAPVHVIRNGVALDETSRIIQREGPLVLGTAARLSPDKRLGDLLDAIRIAAPRLPQFTLRIAGGPERGFESHAVELRDRADGLPVEWCGELPDTRDFLSGLDVFVMISEPSGCPNASLEAMAAGVPVIATDVGGAAEQIENGTNGVLVPARNAAALAEAIVQLAQEPVRREVFARAGRERIREQFSIERMIRLYAEVCGLSS